MEGLDENDRLIRKRSLFAVISSITRRSVTDIEIHTNEVLAPVASRHVHYDRFKSLHLLYPLSLSLSLSPSFPFSFLLAMA
jgi:hypothetical protein